MKLLDLDDYADNVDVDIFIKKLYDILKENDLVILYHDNEVVAGLVSVSKLQEITLNAIVEKLRLHPKEG